MPLTSLDLYSEPYGATGNIGDNIKRLLGAPSLDPLQTVIRESLQNIADAAKLGTGPEVTIRLRRLSDVQRTVLRSNVFIKLPKAGLSGVALGQFLANEDAVVLEICDFRTSGLGGPTRADRIPIGTEQTDFVDFLRNVGVPRDTKNGGGTYGFGKVSLYRVSKCHAILVDTLVAGNPEKSRRLIASQIGESFGIPNNGMYQRFTGRHWWGIADPEDGVVDPLVNGGAEELAAELGFLPRTGSKSGTSIMILDFDGGDDDLETVGQRIVETILWFFWPRLLDDTPIEKKFHCSVEIQGKSLRIPKPENFSPLDLFAKAMRAARAKEGNDVRPIKSRRPRMELGCLALETGLRTQRRPLILEESLIPDVSKHIALMRPVELVVKYIEGSALPNESMEWAGVFITNDKDEVERAFANSEPPAHDTWESGNLPKGRAKTFVNVAIGKLEQYAREMGELPLGQPSSLDSGPPLAGVAGKLGKALEQVGGDGPRPRHPENPNGGGKKSPKARASRPQFKRLEWHSGQTVAVFSTEVSQDGNRSGTVLVANAAIAIDGAAATAVDNGIAHPWITGIKSVVGIQKSNGDRIVIAGKDGLYEISVCIPSNTAVTVEAQVLESGQS